MPPFRKPTLVTLRRQNPSQAWGFRLGGGAELGQSFQIQKVTPDSLAYLGGLSENDELVRIGNISLRGLTHDEVQQIILRCTHCIDLFIIRDEDNEIEPRYLLNRPEIVSERTQIVYQDQAPKYNKESYIYTMESTTTITQSELAPNATCIDIKQGSSHAQQSFNAGSTNDGLMSPTSSLPPKQPSNSQDTCRQLSTPTSDNKPISPVRDSRVFGVKPKSPTPFNQSMSFQDSSTPHSISPTPNQYVTQSIPSTPTSSKNFSFSSSDFNNNPVNGDKKIFGLPTFGSVKQISPLGNHGVQPITNEKKYFGVNSRQRLNSLSSDRDWKSSLPQMNIPNTDQLLPSFTKQQQTYINQTPPTEKNLRPSLVGLERRRICPVWPPPHRGYSRAGVYAEDSPNSKMCSWPPRSQSVDRDFGSSQRGMTPDRGEPYYDSRVRRSSKVWPPPSNATPAGRSGYFPDENDQINYAYNPSREASPGPGLVYAHIPPTYRPPPNTQYTQVVNDF